MIVANIVRVFFGGMLTAVFLLQGETVLILEITHLQCNKSLAFLPVLKEQNVIDLFVLQ